MKAEKGGGRRDVEMKLLHVELLGKDLVNGGEELNERPPITPRESLLYFGRSCYRMCQTQGRTLAILDLVGEGLVIAEELLPLVGLDEPDLTVEVEEDEKEGACKGEKEEGDKELPFQADVMDPSEVHERLPLAAGMNRGRSPSRDDRPFHP
jgi:hypothetical protein